MKLLDVIRDGIRRVMRSIARFLNSVTGGKLSPNMVTITGLLAHIPIALLIATLHPWKAAVLLVVFGLFDTLDGELARLQKRETTSGMLLDSITDRMKEIMLYTALGYNIIATTGRPYLAVWAISACGAALLVSYVNAWGEVVVATHNIDKHSVNKSFRGGLASFEVRMFIVLVGLLSGRIALALIVITLAASFTAIMRLARITRKLADVQN